MPKSDHIVVAKAKNFQWYYTVVAGNNQVRETSETYVRRSNCMRAARTHGLDIYLRENGKLKPVELAV